MIQILLNNFFVLFNRPARLFLVSIPFQKARKEPKIEPTGEYTQYSYPKNNERWIHILGREKENLESRESRTEILEGNDKDNDRDHDRTYKKESFHRK